MTADPDPLLVAARLLLKTGRLMLEAGASTSRVERTMLRMGGACGVPSVQVYATPTGIFVSLSKDDQVLTRLVTVEKRGIDLGRVLAAHQISRDLERGAITAQEAIAAIDELPRAVPGYPFGVKLAARGLSCACWALLMGGAWSDFLPAMLAGFIVHVVYDRLARVFPEFLAIFFGALVGTMWAALAVSAGFGEHAASLVVGVILPLVPGMAITSSVRDLINGDLVSGVARGAEALLVAIAIAAGVWTVFSTLSWTVWL